MNLEQRLKSSLRLAAEVEYHALERIFMALSTFPGVEKVVFFGSRARGDFKGSSDMDILIVISDIRMRERIISILHDIELEYDLPISPSIITSREYEKNKEIKSSFIEKIEREGIILYDLEHP